jgi:hypothetical protein
VVRGSVSFTLAVLPAFFLTSGSTSGFVKQCPQLHFLKLGCSIIKATAGPAPIAWPAGLLQGYNGLQEAGHAPQENGRFSVSPGVTSCDFCLNVVLCAVA